MKSFMESKGKGKMGWFLRWILKKLMIRLTGIFCIVCWKKSFGGKWCDWVMKTVKDGKVAIKTNDMIGPYFTTHKGVRQGDPFSPLLFNIAADGLAYLIQKA
jgi:hypothetical protein